MTAITALPSLLATTALPGMLPDAATGALGALSTGVAPASVMPTVDFAALLAPIAERPTRHGDAEGGKDLPAATEDTDEPDDPLAWLAAPLAPLFAASTPDVRKPVSGAAIPAIVASTVVGASQAVVSSQPPIVPPSSIATAAAPTPPSAGSLPVDSATTIAPAPLAAATAPPPMVPGVAIVADAAPRGAIGPVDLPAVTIGPVARQRATALSVDPNRTSARALATQVIAAPTLDTPPIVSGPRIAPAAQMFAGAIRRALGDDAPTTTVAIAAAPTTDLAPRAVAATHDAHGAALDVSRGDWPTRMMERIEILRDAADAVDTRVRLVPDALGAIDVSLKHDGDAVRVQLTASQPETRQLLIDAQPRLDSLAEARGIKLSHGGSSGAGDSTGQQRQAPQPQQFQPSAPASARAADDDRSDDQRVA